MKTINKREIFTASQLRLREIDGKEESRIITGYAILFDVPSATLYEDEDEVIREVIAPEAVSLELLDSSDIKMTMFHDRQLLLARSNKGSGTLSYGVDDKGVYFEFEAPDTADGDKAIELVKRGDIAGCSFAFSTRYYDRAFVEESVVHGDKVEVTYRVKVITGIYDFTLAADPAYPDTSVEAREIVDALHQRRQIENKKIEKQIAEMRRAASTKIV